MVYDIKCKNCDYGERWEVTLDYYEKHIGGKCPECGKETIYQDMSNNRVGVVFKGSGWTRNGSGFYGDGHFKKGTIEDHEDALRENDYMAEQPDKNDHWKRETEKRNKIEKKVEEIKKGGSYESK